MKYLKRRFNISFKSYLKKEGLTDLERLMLSNKKEWQNSHLLWLIEHEDNIIKFSNLTEKVYELEKTVQALQDFINNNGELNNK